MKLLITGSRGFVGRRLSQVAEDIGIECVLHRSQRTDNDDGGGGHQQVFQADISPNTDWSKALVDVDCVVHCAARVHQMKESESDALLAYRRINTEGTLNLAHQALACGVKRFIFLSSIKVNGEASKTGQPFTSKVDNIPSDAYGISKFVAEQELLTFGLKTGLEVVIIRPPLVYGPNVKANFLSMLKWIKRGIPLPLGAIKNQRSLVFVDNLVDLILICTKHNMATGKVFLVSDDEDVSTSGLLSAIASALSVPNRQLPVPQAWLHFVAKVMGKPQITLRLCSSLQLDISETKKILEWKPPVSLQEGLKITADAFLEQQNNK